MNGKDICCNFCDNVGDESNIINNKNISIFRNSKGQYLMSLFL